MNSQVNCYNFTKNTQQHRKICKWKLKTEKLSNNAHQMWKSSNSNKIDIMEFTMRATHFLIRINTAAASLLLNANHVRILDAFFFFTPQFTDYVSFAKDSHIHKIYLIHHGCVCAFLFDLRFGKKCEFLLSVDFHCIHNFLIFCSSRFA